MADNYKEGVDFEWVKGNEGKSNFRTRRFFTKSEKAALAAPANKKTETKPAKKKTETKPAKKKTETKPVDWMDGYRKDGVKTSSLSNVTGGRGDGGAEKIKRAADKAISKAEANPKKVSYAEWKSMNPRDRVRLGLPASVIGGELGFSRFWTGITGKEYTMKTK